MKRLPVVATIIVALAVAAMIGLGIWQLDRRAEKQALLARYRANLTQPAIAFPVLPPVPDSALFRRSSLTCLEVTDWRVIGGRAADGTTGYRHIARCRTGAEGPGASIDMGVARDPRAQPRWNGGRVAGTITLLPNGASMIALASGRAPPASAMLVADTPALGLQRSARPSPEGVPNNHLAYAGQWFFFAAAALAIYLIALRRRLWPQAPGRKGHPPAA